MKDKQTSHRFTWQGIEDQTIETVSIQPTEQTIHIHASLQGLVDRKPVDLTYHLVVAMDWSWQAFTLQADKQDIVHLVRNSNKMCHAPYIDFCLTPLTNTLPIRKENLPIGEKAVIEVLYICYPDQELQIVSQEYERLSEREYRFMHLGTGFEAVIQVDEHGFVTQYPALFTRIPTV